MLARSATAAAESAFGDGLIDEPTHQALTSSVQMNPASAPHVLDFLENKVFAPKAAAMAQERERVDAVQSMQQVRQSPYFISQFSPDEQAYADKLILMAGHTGMHNKAMDEWFGMLKSKYAASAGGKTGQGLAALDSLHDQHLITDDEYKVSRQRILLGTAPGSSEAERDFAHLPPDEREAAIQNRARELAGLNKIQKDPEAIGQAREAAAASEASVKSAEKALAIAQKAAEAKPDDADVQEALRMAQVRYDKAVGAEGAAKGAKGKAEAGSRRGGIVNPGPSQQATPATDPVKKAAGAIERFKQKHGRAPDKNNSDDVAEMRSLIGV